MHSMPDPSLAEVVTLLHRVAREEILPRFQRVRRELKADGTWVTAADTAMQARVQRELADRWPHIAFLGEEMPGSEQQSLMRHTQTGLWVLDPLDGTSNFAAGLPIFGPSLALIRNARIELGVVIDVPRDETFSAALGHGAWLNNVPLSMAKSALPLAKTIACVDFKRLPASLAGRLATMPPYASQRSIGSVALDWCWVAAGRFHLYLHGSQGLWDYCAGHLILSEAGGHSATLDGQAVFDGTLSKRSALCAGDAEHFAQWVEWLNENR